MKIIKWNIKSTENIIINKNENYIREINNSNSYVHNYIINKSTKQYKCSGTTSSWFRFRVFAAQSIRRWTLFWFNRSCSKTIIVNSFASQLVTQGNRNQQRDLGLRCTVFRLVLRGWACWRWYQCWWCWCKWVKWGWIWVFDAWFW
jgi:hypothetical protein